VAKREEKGTAIPWLGEAGERGQVLDGLFVPAASGRAGGAVIAPPHPLYGGSMASPVVSELAWAVTKNGMASLRFDWRGVGASSGAASGEVGHGVEDFTAALLHLGRTVAGPLVAVGYSFGAAMAARASGAQQRVTRLVLVAPPPGLLDRASLLERETLILSGEHDAIAPPAALEKLVADLPRARYVRLAEADHSFGAGLAALGRAVTEWLGAAAGERENGSRPRIDR
jgi:alpha/beta superfamily hydrolase